MKWEISHGTQLARARGIPFCPCLMGVGYEALATDATRSGSDWQKWEVGMADDDDRSHPEAEFQAVRLDEPEGLMRLTETLRAAI